MLSKERHRQHKSKLPPDMFKQSISGTLSPETTATTSSGYSTGGSSVSTRLNPSLKKLSSSSSSATSNTRKEHHQQQKQQKTKSKGLSNLLTKLKNLLLPSKNKPMRSTTSREISSTNRLRQYRQQSPIYDVLPSSSSLIINHGISLPFTYYSNSPIRQSRANFEKIAAWLNHTDKLKYNSNEFLFIDTHQQPSSSHVIDNQGITLVMKKTPINIKPPKRSSSLVTRITRPIIEQQSQQTLSPSASFSSSILGRGMSERITPPYKTEILLSKSNRRRTIDFSRRRTIDGTNEHKSNKENISIKNHEKSSNDIYQFPNSSSTNKIEILLPSSKHIATKKYYFHSHPIKSNEDLLNNSYGLTILNQQQQQQQQHQPRHSATTTVLMMSQVPSQISSAKQSYTPRITRKQQPHEQQTLESLDDVLCDREVESYFYPTSEHIYMNVENPSSSLSSIHGTLC